MYLAVALSLALSLVLTGCSEDGRREQLVITGSTTILPIAEIAGEQFSEARDSDVLVSGVGSSAGIEAVAAGTSQIGTSSRDLKEEEEGLGLVDTPMAYDGIAVIVNPSNPVEELTTEQLRAIFSGEVTNWSEVGGPDLAIDLVNRDEASGTREAFNKIVMDEAKFDRSAAVLPGTGQVRDVVSRSVGAVGYISVGFVKPRYSARSVKAIVVDGVVPSADTVADGSYPVRRVLHFFTKGRPSGLAKEYIEYVLSDEVQQGVVVDAGFIPVTLGEAAAR